jgi:hypothetical protein
MASVGSVDKRNGYNIRCVYDPKAISAATQSVLVANRRSVDAPKFIPSVLDTCCNMSAVERAKFSQNTATMRTMVDTSNFTLGKVESATATLYPNPVINGQLTIDNGEVEIGMVEVLSSNGAVVHRQDFGSQTTATLLLHGLQGTYFVRMGTTTQRIVIVK